jgi:hypothetical protein
MAYNMRRRGYITVAENSKSGDYLKMAYALALSLKATGQDHPYLTVCVPEGTEVPEKYATVFDNVVEMYGMDRSFHTEWKVLNKWKVYNLSPYEETVLLDADMIFPPGGQNIGYWWDSMCEIDIQPCMIPRTYRNEHIVVSEYRKKFLSNELPSLYTAFLYFKKNERNKEYFDLIRDVTDFWSRMKYHLDNRQYPIEAIREFGEEYVWYHFMPDLPERLSGDVAFSVAAKLMGLKFPKYSVTPTFVHMRSGCQNFEDPTRIVCEDWTKFLHIGFNHQYLTIQNHRQLWPFHYHIKSFMDDEKIEVLEKMYESVL